MWRTRNEQMHMLFPYVSLDDLHLKFGTYVSDDLPHSCSNFSSQQLLAVFRDPNHMIFDIETGMGCPSVMFHAHPLLKLSPEGEGFNIPKRDY